MVLATVVSLVIVAVGMLGKYFTKSQTLLTISIIALALNLNWVFGFMLSNKVKKELNRINYRNLNGGVAFELIMVYCQMQILLVVAIFVKLLYSCTVVLTEMRELESFFLKADGALWEKDFSLMSVTAVEVQLGVFFFLQLILFIVIMAVLVGFAKSGMRWGDDQVQSRSKGYFLAVACVIIPFLALAMIHATHIDNTYLSELPEMQHYLSNKY